MRSSADSSRTPLAERLGISTQVLLATLLCCLWLLNAADYLLTLRALELGQALELNGLMRRLYDLGTLPAGVVKIGVVTLGALALWRLRRRRWALVATVALVLVFAALVSYELLSARHM